VFIEAKLAGEREDIATWAPGRGIEDYVVFASTLRRLQPVSPMALLATLVLLFGFQGDQIVKQPLVIVLLAIPIVIQVYLNAGIAYWLNRALGVLHNVACPSALIGASNEHTNHSR
jgi:arsenite transporter